MNTCKELPYEELNAMQVSAYYGLSLSVKLIISQELQGSTGE